MATNTNPFYTYSATAGSSKTLQKPQDGGDNNQWGNYINTDLDEIVSAVNALSDKIADANEKTLVDFTATTDAVNHVGITNAATGNGPTISTAGTDSNVDLNVTPKGTGDSVFTNKIKVDDVIEKTTDHGVEIEGVLVKDSIVKTDDIQEKTSDHGVEIEQVTLKDGKVTATTLRSGQGSQSAPSIEIGDDNSGLFDAGNDAIGFTTGGTQKMHIDANGKIGVGTDSPNAQLEISNDGTSGNIPTVRLNSTEGNVGFGDVLGQIDWKSADSGRSGDPAAVIKAVSSEADGSHTDLTFSTGENADAASEQMRIDSSGNLKFNSGFGSVGTAYGCRAWVNFNGTVTFSPNPGTNAIRGSGNVTSITDNGTGDYTINFTNAMPDTNYLVHGTMGQSSSGANAIIPTIGNNHALATSSVRVGFFVYELAHDPIHGFISIFR